MRRAAQPTLDLLRRLAVARTLFAPTTLTRAIVKLRFVQADPIRAPARAQDLTLRHRVKDYHAGDLERRYASLPIEEDFLVNYGFVPREVCALMHPRSAPYDWTPTRRRRARSVLAFVRERGMVHPREVDERFAHGTVTNYWGGSSTATTHLLEAMHYRGLLRVVRRERGVRVYAVREQPPRVAGTAIRRSRVDALVDIVTDVYAPVPRPTLLWLVNRLQYAVPQWRGELKPALKRALARLASTRIDGTEWFWPASEAATDAAVDDRVRLLSPFDPIVWDRRRFELFWGWAYRFEAYTPAARRKFGYYALPLLWRERVVGWANAAVLDGRLTVAPGYVSGKPPADRAFTRELEAEIDRLRVFLRVTAEEQS